MPLSSGKHFSLALLPATYNAFDLYLVGGENTTTARKSSKKRKQGVKYLDHFTFSCLYLCRCLFEEKTSSALQITVWESLSFSNYLSTQWLFVFLPWRFDDLCVGTKTSLLTHKHLISLCDGFSTAKSAPFYTFLPKPKVVPVRDLQCNIKKDMMILV